MPKVFDLQSPRTSVETFFVEGVAFLFLTYLCSIFRH